MASQEKHSTLEIPSTQKLAAQGLKSWRPWLQSKERWGLRPQTFAFIFLCFYFPFADRRTELLDSHLQWISNQLWMDVDFSPSSPPLGSGWPHPWTNYSLAWDTSQPASSWPWTWFLPLCFHTLASFPCHRTQLPCGSTQLTPEGFVWTSILM